MPHIKKFHQLNESINNSELELKITDILNNKSYVRKIERILDSLPNKLKNILTNFLQKDTLVDLDKYNFFDKINRFIKRGKDISEIEEIIEENKNESTVWTIFVVGGVLILTYLLIKVFGKGDHDRFNETHALILFPGFMWICFCAINATLAYSDIKKYNHENPEVRYIRKFKINDEIKTIKVIEKDGEYKAIVE